MPGFERWSTERCRTRHRTRLKTPSYRSTHWCTGTPTHDSCPLTSTSHSFTVAHVPPPNPSPTFSSDPSFTGGQILVLPSPLTRLSGGSMADLLSHTPAWMSFQNPKSVRSLPQCSSHFLSFGYSRFSVSSALCVFLFTLNGPVFSLSVQGELWKKRNKCCH